MHIALKNALTYGQNTQQSVLAFLQLWDRIRIIVFGVETHLQNVDGDKFCDIICRVVN